MNSTAHWFKAAELNGEHTDILYARVSSADCKPEWLSVSHSECDGLGGFAQLLRDTGATDIELPKTNFSNKSILSPFLNLRNRYQPKSDLALRSDWNLTSTADQSSASSNPTAWHLFSEDETAHIRDYCRSNSITVNNLLLKLLDQTARPTIKRPALSIPWFIPVNIRGDVSYTNDTENHVSGIEPIIAADDSVQDIQRQIIERFEQGEHRLNHLILSLTKIIPLKLKSSILSKTRNNSKGTIGAFSNLGVWDSKKVINTKDSWLFCPPVCYGQQLSAGCVTFQNRLSLTIQSHPHTSQEQVNDWVQSWSKLISRSVRSVQSV